jgi:hypothetical protein
MKNVLRIEFIKTIHLPSFWAILLLHSFFFFAVVALGANFNINIQGVQVFRLFTSDFIWGTMAWIASWFNLLLAIMLIVLTGNELQYNTFRRQLLDGLNRNQLIVGKLVLIFVLSIYVVLLVTLTGLTVGLTSGESWVGGYFQGFKYVLVLWVQSFAYMALAMMLVMIFKNIAITIVTYLLYFIMIEPIIRVFFSSTVDVFFPMKLISNLTPAPNVMGMLSSQISNIQGIDPNSVQQLQSIPDGISIALSVPVCLAYIVVFVVVSRLILKYRDL